MKLKLNQIKETKPFRDHGNIKELAENIKKEGLLQPLVINQNNELICGRRRYEAVKLLNWDEVEVYQIETKDEIDKLSKAIAENIMRKQLTWQEEVKAKKMLDELMRKKYGSADRYSHPKATAESAVGWFSAKTAELLNEPRRTTETDIQLAKALEEYPELEKIKTKTGALVELKKIKDREKIKTLKLVEGLYDVIVIDPPWETIYNPTGRRGGAKYPTMTVEQIKNIKLPMADDCVVWLWTINRYLHEAFHVLEAWQLEYRNTFVWVKPQLGLGNWGRTQTEFVLLATKGNPVVEFSKQKNVIIADRKRHSEKPDEFYLMVEKTCLGKRRLDYFARRERKGWSVFGTLEE